MTTIEKIGVADAEALSDLATRAYLSVYTGMLDADEIALRLQNYRPDFFANELQESVNYFFTLKHQNAWLGYLHLKCGPAPTPLAAPGRWLQVSRLYVSPNILGQGHGKALVEFAETFAANKDYAGLWLCCFDQNIRALKFYAREGYSAVGAMPFTILNQVRFDILMSKRLVT